MSESPAQSGGDVVEPQGGEAPLQAEAAPPAAAQAEAGAPAVETAAADPTTGGFSQAEIDALVDSAGGASGEGPQPGAETARTGDDEFAAAMMAAIDGKKPAPAGDAAVPTTPFAFPDFAASTAEIDASRVSMLSDVKLNVRIELGRTRMLLEDVLKLGDGSVVELDRLAGDPVDVLVNGRLVARGEVLILNDNFCVRISEVVSNDPHRVAV